MFLQKKTTDKSSLQRWRATEIPSLAATAAATAAAFAFTAIVEDQQFVHGFHLLSYVN